MRSSILKLLPTTAAVSAFVFLAPAEADAQSSADSPAVSSVARAFEDMIHNPGDAALTQRYAQMAAAAGDLEGAVGALSRLLMSDPDNAELHRQLGVLYRALDSSSAAEMHDKRALELSTDPAQRQAIEADLAALQSAAPGDRVAVTLQAGMSYQTNSAIATQESGAYSATQAKAKPDENAVLYAGIGYSHDFDNAVAERWDSTLTLYATRQDRYKDDDLDYARLTSGPTFYLFGSPGSVLRTYVIGESFGLGQDLYQLTGGGGVSWDQTLGGNFISRVEVEQTRRWFNDSERYPGLSNQRASLTLARATIAYTLSGGDRLGLRAWTTDNISQVGYASYREFGLSPVYETHFAGLWGDTPWLIIAEGRYLRRPYREAVPSQGGSPGISGSSSVTTFSSLSPIASDSGQLPARNDTEWGGTVTLLVPIVDRWAFMTRFSQANEFSNIATFRYRNSQITTSIQYSF
jgi:tetratricopeptide (TPR) repeat protein